MTRPGTDVLARDCGDCGARGTALLMSSRTGAIYWECDQCGASLLAESLSPEPPTLPFADE